MKVANTLDFLLGTWHVDRSIVDRCSRTNGSFTGSATLALIDDEDGDPRPARAGYGEAGTLTLGTHIGPASRRLEYVRIDMSTVKICFADGRPFIDLNLESGRWHSVHPCGADVYEITTIALSQDAVEERWQVRGPTKSYDAVTMLTRTNG